MKRLFIILLFLVGSIKPTAAQQNWAAVPCSKMKWVDAFSRMFMDSLHNQIILNSFYSYSVCNTRFKGLVAYDVNGFHALDLGVNTHDPDPNPGGAEVSSCIPFENKTLFGGGFYSVGTNTLYTKGIALWNGAVWDTFPTHCFNPAPNNNSGGGFFGFVKWNGKLWMYGVFDTIGNTVTTNLTAYDGHTFIAVPPIPVSTNYSIVKMIVYKNKLIATGNFYDYPSNPNSISCLAQFDGTTWSSVGAGILGGLSTVNDMIIYKDTLYIGGAYPKDAGNAGNSLMKWDGTQLHDAGFGNVFCDYGAIQNLVTYRNRLYAFGNFDCAANQKAFGVAYYENGTWTVPQDSIDNLSITGAVVYNDAIYISGGFNSINGDTTIQKFAKLICPDFDAAAGCVSAIKESSKKLDVKIFPNPSNDRLYLEFEQSSAIDKVTLLNTLGQEMYKLLKPVLKQEIDISQLPSGIYFLKEESKQGQGVFKVVKE